MSVVVFALVIFQAVVQFGGSSYSKVLGYAANISPDEVVRLTNEKRAEAGLSPVVYNATLAQGAVAKGNDMFNKDYWAHAAPDGTQPWAFFVSAGYRYKYAGENLARDFSDAGSAVNAWMASPSHRENMLSPKYKEIGIGVVDGNLAGVDTTIIVQFFGTKIADTLPVQPVAAAETTNEKPTPSAIPTVIGSVETPAPKYSSISPMDLTKIVSLAVVLVLLVVLVVDYAIITRKNLKRIGGRPFAHIAFLGMITVILLVAKAGKII
ncbi:MAG: CAP domain-containing protein [Patescibacteria group bacterium]